MLLIANWPAEAMAVANNADKYDTTIDDIINFKTYYSGGTNLVFIICLSVGGVIVLGGVGFCVYWFAFRKKKANKVAEA